MTRPHHEAPTDLALWSLHCFCIRARSNPKTVVRMDNNGEVLLRCVGGASRESLVSSGIAANQSQLTLLEAYGLVTIEGDVITTSFPVLGPAQIAEVRDRATAAAADVMPEVVSRAETLVGLLAARDLYASGHAVVFGHALDGVIWDLLRTRGALPGVELTIEEPYWRGSFWAVYPGREGSAGTNEINDGSATLVMVWDDETAESLRSMAAEPALPELLGSIEARDESTTLLGLSGDHRPIPVIGTATEDDLHLASGALAETVSSAIPDGAGCRLIFEEAGLEPSEGDATVIFTHELIWEIAALLAGSGVVSPPPDSDLTSRLFVRMSEPGRIT